MYRVAKAPGFGSALLVAGLFAKRSPNSKKDAFLMSTHQYGFCYRRSIMKRQLIGSLVGLSMLTLVTAGCSTLTGAAVGAGSGAAIGAGTGYGAKKGALIGGGIGAAAGTLYDATRHDN
jgi:hypothetical protein